jgi:hypothetical protein
MSVDDVIDKLINKRKLSETKQEMARRALTMKPRPTRGGKKKKVGKKTRKKKNIKKTRK